MTDWPPWALQVHDNHLDSLLLRNDTLKICHESVEALNLKMKDTKVSAPPAVHQTFLPPSPWVSCADSNLTDGWEWLPCAYFLCFDPLPLQQKELMRGAVNQALTSVA